MLYKEFKRLIFNFPAIALILAALIVSLLFNYVMVHNIIKEKEDSDSYYKEYILSLNGGMTKEKEKYISDEREMIHDIVAREEEMQESYNMGEITAEEYQEYLDDDYYAVEHYSAIERVQKQCESVLKTEKETGVKASFIYDTYWNMYFDMNITTIVQMLIVMMIIIRYLSMDYISGIWIMISSYRNGRSKMLNTKMGVTALLCIGISLTFSIVHLVIFYNNYYMPDINAPVQSLQIFQMLPINISIGNMVLLTILLRAVALCVFGLLVFVITSLTKNLTISFGICSLVTVLPMLFGTTLKAARDISVYEYVLGIGIIKRSTTITQLLGVFCIFTIIILGICMINVFLQSDLRRKRIRRK